MPENYIGIMCGTSLDSLDLSLCDFEKNKKIMNFGKLGCRKKKKKYGQEDPLGPRVSESRFSRFPGIIPPRPLA